MDALAGQIDDRYRQAARCACSEVPVVDGMGTRMRNKNINCVILGSSRASMNDKVSRIRDGNAFVFNPPVEFRMWAKRSSATGILPDRSALRHGSNQQLPPLRFHLSYHCYNSGPMYSPAANSSLFSKYNLPYSPRTWITSCRSGLMPQRWPRLLSTCTRMSTF